MKMKLRTIWIVIGIWTSLESTEPYHARVRLEADSVRLSASNLVDLRRELQSSSIEKLIPLYTPTSAVSIGIDLRGLEVLASFAKNSTALSVNIPNAVITKIFDGGSRENSVTLFKDFISDGGKGQQLLKRYAKYSPIDPIAGNPNSLIEKMTQVDYEIGHLAPLSGCSCGWTAQPVLHQFQAGSHVGRAFAHGFDTTIVTLPLRYSYSPDREWAFIIDMPLTYLRNGGASSLYTSLGTGLRVPVTREWSLTSIYRFGSGGSVDLVTAGSFVSASIISAYDKKIANFVFSLTDSVTYLTSTNLWLGGINFNYRLQQYVLKNGFMITTCNGMELLGRPVKFTLSFVDTYYTGHRLFMTRYDEVGIGLVINRFNPCLDYDTLILKFVYQFGQKKYHGYFVNMTYQF